MARKIGTAVGIVFVLAIVAVAAALAFRAVRQHSAAQALAIRSANGIEEGGFVSIGGIKQWIQIRGEDRDNPVLLFVHGGPGGSTIPISSGWQPWEKFFTVVQWDQRGAGRTYGANGAALAPTMTLDRMTRDGVELAEYLRAHLHKDKIVLVGHSWGSFLGMHIVKQRQDLFHAFVGTGVVVGRETFETQFVLTIAHLLERAKAAGSTEALAELAPIAARPVMSPSNLLVAERWSRALSLPSVEDFKLAGPIPPPFMPGFTLLDWWNWSKGMAFSAAYLRGPGGSMVQHDLASLGSAFAIPLIFIEGDEDYMTPAGPAERYFQSLSAPLKAFVHVPGGDHFIPFDRPDDFLSELVKRVRPLADPGAN